MSKNRNYGSYYKQPETETEPVTPAEDKNLAVETEVIQKTAAIVKGHPRVNLRAAANKEASVLAVIPENTAVKILDDSNEYWFRIEANGKVGYMMSKYLKRV